MYTQKHTHTQKREKTACKHVLMLLVRTSSQLPPNYNLASGGDTCHSFWQTQGESNRAGNVREGGNRRGAEPEREGMGNLILKGNEKLFKT